MDWVEEGDHLVLSRLTERGRFLLINDICCKSPKAEIKYFCLNVTFVSFAGVEKGICQNPWALAKGGFPRGITPYFHINGIHCSCFTPRIYSSPFHLFRRILNMEALKRSFWREEGRFSWWSRVTVGPASAGESNGSGAWPPSSAGPATAARISLPPMCYIRLAWSGSETVNTPQFRKSAKFAETKRQYRK